MKWNKGVFKLSDGSYVDYRLDVSAVGKVNLSLLLKKRECKL